MQTSTPSSTRPSGNVATLARTIERTQAAIQTYKSARARGPFGIAETLRFDLAKVLDVPIDKIRTEATEDLASEISPTRELRLSVIIDGEGAVLEARRGVVGVFLPAMFGGYRSTEDHDAKQIAKALADFAKWARSTAVAQ